MSTVSTKFRFRSVDLSFRQWGGTQATVRKPLVVIGAAGRQGAADDPYHWIDVLVPLTLTNWSAARRGRGSSFSLVW